MNKLTFLGKIFVFICLYAVIYPLVCLLLGESLSTFQWITSALFAFIGVALIKWLFK